MTVYTTLPTDDENLEVTVIDDPDLVVLNINPAAVSGGGGGGSGTVTLINTGTGLTGGPISTTGTISIDETSDINFNSVTADFFGVQHFTAKARETITAGQPVYISGHSGNTPEVMVADFDDPAKMPAFGIASADIANNNNGTISTYGDLKNVDTTGSTEGETWAVGDELFVNNAKLTNTRPTGSSEEIQKIAKIIRVHAQNGQMFLMGAGRSNDVPNLATQNVFIGNLGGVERRQLDTSDILEDASNLFYTDARVQTVIDTNTAGFITADSTDTLTNKSGNISQWTNDAGYLTTESDSQTLSFASPDLSISNGNSVDLSALTTTSLPFSSITATPTTVGGYGITDGVTLTGTETLTNKTVTDANINGAYFDVLYATNKFEFATEYTNPAWSIYNNQFAINTWKDSGNNLVLRQRWETNAGHSYMQYDVIGTADDGTGNVDFSIKGDAVQLLARNNSGGESDLTIDGSSINFFAEYEFPTTDGTAGQVLQTDGNGQLSFQTAGGLPASTTPTLSASTTPYTLLDYTVTISNYSSYVPGSQFRLKINLNSDGSVVAAPSDFTDNGDGTFTVTLPSTTGAATLNVKAQDFNSGASAAATLGITLTPLSFNARYWRIKDFDGAGNNSLMIANWRMYSSGGQSGTAYPSNMTSNTAPTPYVASGTSSFSATYDYFKAFDSDGTNTMYWNLGTTTMGTDYLAIDLGSAQTIESFEFKTGSNVAYAGPFSLYYATQSDFSDEVKVQDFQFTTGGQTITFG